MMCTGICSVKLLSLDLNEAAERFLIHAPQIRLNIYRYQCRISVLLPENALQYGVFPQYLFCQLPVFFLM